MSTGPDERAARGRMRAGHADREHVINELKAAFVQGRLDQADIPAPASASTAGVSSPGRTLARAAKRAAICLLAAAALAEAAFLAGNFLLIVAACFAAIAASGFLGYGIIDAVRERNTRERLASGPGPGAGDGGAGAAGGPPARGRLDPGERGGQTMAEARARRPRPAGALQRGWAVS